MAGARPKDSTPWIIHAMGFVVLAALTGVAVLWSVNPILEARREALRRAAELSDAQHALQEKKATLTGLKRNLKSTRTALEATPVRLIPIAEVNRRLATLTELAANVGLNVEQIEPGAVRQAGLFSKMNIRVSATGSYPKCAAFVHSVRAQLKDTGVASFRVTRRSSATNVEAAFECELTWYAKPTDLATASVDGQTSPLPGGAR